MNWSKFEKDSKESIKSSNILLTIQTLDSKDICNIGTAGTLMSHHRHPCKFPFSKRENYISILKTNFDQIDNFF